MLASKYSVQYFFNQLRCKKTFVNVRPFCESTNGDEIMKFLNVAEKNDAAKSIAAILSNGTAIRREGLSKFNKLYLFDANFRGTQANMIMTSVSGHLMTFDFLNVYRSWHSCDPITLFEAPVSKQCPDNFTAIKKTLEKEVS